MRRFQSPTLPLILCIAALLACKKGNEDTSNDESEEKTDETSEETTKKGGTKQDEGGSGIAAVTPKSNDPGPAYLAVKGTGVVALDGGKVTTVQALRFSVLDMVYGPDNAVWVSATSGLYRIVGTTSKAVNQTGRFQGIAVVSEKEAYGVNYKGVHHYDGSSWTVEDKAKIGVTLLTDVEVDKDGNVWVVSSNAIHQKKKGGTDWTAADLSSLVSGKPFLRHIAKGPDGTLYLAYNRGILRLVNGSWEKVPGDYGFVGAEHVVVSPTGTVAAIGGLDKLHVVGPSGHKQIDPASASLNVKAFRELAIDGSNRVWLTTDHGLIVLDQQGKKLQHWAPSTLPGVTGEVTHIAVAGSGPKALPSPTAPVTGTVTGKVLRAGTAAANADVELCASPSMVFRATPCEGKAFAKTTKTDAAGTFTIPDVPIADYGFAIKTPGEKWKITVGSQCCSQMTKGQTYDVGSITLK